MATRAERGKCVLLKDNRNVQALPVLLMTGACDMDLVMGLVEQVAYDHWQIAHDEFCDFGTECRLHTNPMDEES